MTLGSGQIVTFRSQVAFPDDQRHPGSRVPVSGRRTAAFAAAPTAPAAARPGPETSPCILRGPGFLVPGKGWTGTLTCRNCAVCGKHPGARTSPCLVRETK